MQHSKININENDDSESRLRVRLDYRQIMDDLNTNQQLYTSANNNNNNLEKKIHEIDQVYTKVKMPRECVLDASTVRTVSNFASMRIRTIDQAGYLDRTYEFTRNCEKVLSKLHKNADEFYKIFCNYHHIATSPSPMNGRIPTKLFHNEHQEKRKQRIKSVRQQKQTREELEKTRIYPKEIKECNSEFAEQTEKQIKHVKQCLLEFYKTNNSYPIDYFLFVLDPTSFARTVENMFHISFLIKEGFVTLFHDNNHLPVLEPTAKVLNQMIDNHNTLQTNKSSNHSNQMIMSITMDEWKELVEVYRITKADIKTII